MELTLFRDNFARVPRQVVVLGLYRENRIYGVTISSLQSVSVSDQHQILSFVLKKNSYFSSILKVTDKLTINFLAINQEKISRAYSDNNRSTDDMFEQEVWSRFEGNQVFVNKASFSVSSTFLKSIELEASNILFVSADQVIESNEIGMLMYCERSYGVFQHREN
jgi:flavin reductase (DIM6/NTAB) family NADH-FMN oxidoreductase RutF